MLSAAQPSIPRPAAIAGNPGRLDERVKVARLGFGTGRVCWTMTDARDARTLTRPLEAVHLSRPASSRLMLAQSTCHGSCERQIEQGVGLVWHSSDTLSTEAQRREALWM